MKTNQDFRIVDLAQQIYFDLIKDLPSYASPREQYKIKASQSIAMAEEFINALVEAGHANERNY